MALSTWEPGVKLGGSPRAFSATFYVSMIKNRGVPSGPVLPKVVKLIMRLDLDGAHITALALQKRFVKSIFDSMFTAFSNAPLPCHASFYIQFSFYGERVFAGKQASSTIGAHISLFLWHVDHLTRWGGEGFTTSVRLHSFSERARGFCLWYGMVW